ncbi:MAG: hypothetical protein ACR2OE_01305 [Thermomicrobiales bacterium]
MPRYAIIVSLFIIIGGMTSVPGQVAAATTEAGATPPVRVSASPVAKIPLTWPTTKQVPAGLEITGDGDRSLTEVVASFRDPVAARKQFIAWGWQRNHVRSFHAPAGQFRAQDKINGVYISVHVFGSPDNAAAALDSLFGVLVADSRFKEVPIDPLGERSRALYGKVAYGNEVTIYVQQDNLLIRLTASSPTGDPRDQARDMLKAMFAT